MKRTLIFSILILGVVSAIIWATTRETSPPQEELIAENNWEGRGPGPFRGPWGPDEGFDGRRFSRPDDSDDFDRGRGRGRDNDRDRERREWFEQQKERWDEEAEFRGVPDRGPRWGEFFRPPQNDWFGPDFFRGGRLHGRPPVEHLANNPEALEKLRQHFPKIANLIEETAQNRDHARDLLEQYHATNDAAAREALMTEIRPLLEREFELELMRQRIEIEFLEKKLNLLKEILQKREEKEAEFKELHIRRILEFSAPDEVDSVENDPRTGATDETAPAEAQSDPQDQQ